MPPNYTYRAATPFDKVLIREIQDGLHPNMIYIPPTHPDRTTDLGYIGVLEVPTTPTCQLSSLGLALGETPLNVNVIDYFNSPHNPSINVVESTAAFRVEAETRLNQYYSPTAYTFVNSGIQLPDKCIVLNAPQRQLQIPYTNTIIFTYFYLEQNLRFSSTPLTYIPPGWYFIGTDGFLYTLETRTYETPEVPIGMSLGSGKVYFKIDNSDKLQESLKTTYSMWGSDPYMGRFFTSSILTQGTGSRLYNLEVRNYTETDCRSKIKFNIAYGHYGGSGSRDLGGYDYLTPSKAVYGQAKSLCLESSQSKFIFNGRPTDSIYVVNIKRECMNDKMDPGNWELNLHHLSGSQFGSTHPRNAHTGSNVKLGIPGKITRLIDDSNIAYSNVTSIGEVYKIVSGSLEQGAYNLSSPVQYGLFYPRLGMLVLDGTKLDSQCGFLSVTGSDVAGDNSVKLFKSISGSARYTDLSGDVLGFYARKEKITYRDTYFVRVKNQDCNFSNNPTYVSGSDALIVNDFKGNPTSYITTIGLYNDRKELLAISKLSKPIPKTFTEESMFTVRIKYGD